MTKTPQQSADEFIQNTNLIASDWAQAQAVRTLVRVAMDSDSVVYRATWPSLEVIDRLGRLDREPALAWNGWMASTMDLRNGLSVVEVFAPVDETLRLIEAAIRARG